MDLILNLEIGGKLVCNGHNQWVANSGVANWGSAGNKAFLGQLMSDVLIIKGIHRFMLTAQQGI